MFDKTYYMPHEMAKHSTSSVTVTERRAPTDESVKLLREMEEAAQKRIIDSTIVRNNDFNCRINKVFDGRNGCYRYCVIYELNGKKHTVNYMDIGFDDLSIEMVAEGLRDAVAHHLAAHMLSSAFSQVGKEFYYDARKDRR